MDVLFLSHGYPRTATDPIGSFVLRLAVALRDEDVRVSVVAPGAPGLAAKEEFEGIPVFRFRYAPRRYETLAYTGSMLAQVQGSIAGKLSILSFLAASTGAAHAVASQRRPALVHAHWWFPGGVVGEKVAWLRTIPLVTTLHGSDIAAARSSALASKTFAGVLRRSARVTTVSTWLANEAHALVPEVTPVVAPMPVAPALFYPQGPRARDRLLFVGKLNAQKGIAHLLRALTRLKTKPALDVVVGVGSDASDVRALAAQLGVESQLRFHPLLSQADLAKLYRECTALVTPFTGEGLGLIAIEAALCGMPVVSFASGGLTDIVIDGRTGLLVPTGDEPALAARLDELLLMPDQGAALGAEGRRRALETFAPSAVAKRYASLYREVAVARAK